MEIRSDALKLLVMLRRPEPRAAASIGAWLNIFQVSHVPYCSEYSLQERWQLTTMSEMG